MVKKKKYKLYKKKHISWEIHYKLLLKHHREVLESHGFIKQHDVLSKLIDSYGLAYSKFIHIFAKHIFQLKEEKPLKKKKKKNRYIHIRKRFFKRVVWNWNWKKNKYKYKNKKRKFISKSLKKRDIFILKKGGSKSSSLKMKKYGILSLKVWRHKQKKPMNLRAFEKWVLKFLYVFISKINWHYFLYDRIIFFTLVPEHRRTISMAECEESLELADFMVEFTNHAVKKFNPIMTKKKKGKKFFFWVIKSFLDFFISIAKRIEKSKKYWRYLPKDLQRVIANWKHLRIKILRCYIFFFEKKSFFFKDKWTASQWRKWENKDKINKIKSKIKNDKLKSYFRQFLKKDSKISNKNLSKRLFFYDFFFSPRDKEIFFLRKKTYVNFLWKKVINKTCLRFRLSDYIFALLNKFNDNLFLVGKFDFVLTYYKLVTVLKKKLKVLKKYLRKKVLLKKKLLKFNRKELKLMFSLDYLFRKKNSNAKIFSKYYNILKYSNKILYYLYNNLNITNIIKNKKKLVYLSFFVNITVDEEKYFSLVGLNNYFMEKNNKSFVSGWLLYDRIFNYQEILYQKDFLWGNLTPLNILGKQNMEKNYLMVNRLEKNNSIYFLGKNSKYNNSKSIYSKHVSKAYLRSEKMLRSNYDYFFKALKEKKRRRFSAFLECKKRYIWMAGIWMSLLKYVKLLREVKASRREKKYTMMDCRNASKECRYWKYRFQNFWDMEGLVKDLETKYLKTIEEVNEIVRKVKIYEIAHIKIFKSNNWKKVEACKDGSISCNYSSFWRTQIELKKSTVMYDMTIRNLELIIPKKKKLEKKLKSIIVPLWVQPWSFNRYNITLGILRYMLIKSKVYTGSSKLISIIMFLKEYWAHRLKNIKISINIYNNKRFLLKFISWLHFLIVRNKKSMLSLENYSKNFTAFSKYALFKSVDHLRKKKKYKFKSFFLNIEQKYFSKYSKRNGLNKKKCILHLTEKKTNNFLVLSLFKTKRVIGHTSAGQGLYRPFANSKRQKKGTGIMRKIIFRKLRLRAKKYKLKKVYIKSNLGWNFRVKFLTKYWILRYKLGVPILGGVKVGLGLPYHRGLRVSKRRRK